MRSTESKIPRFYDVLDEELEREHVLRRLFVDSGHRYGFAQMRTTAVELRGRYLAATKVHPSKIFEIHRVKESTRYALQADLAISMSRYVADLPSAPPLKLMQVGTLYRDRPLNEPGYRREFQQGLFGIWGIDSRYADAEVVATAHAMLERVPGIGIEFIQLADQNLFNCLREGLAADIRFGTADIGELDRFGLDSRDVRILKSFYAAGRVPIGEFLSSCTFVDSRLRSEIAHIESMAAFLTALVPTADIRFCLSNLRGTGHYSGMNYQIFVRSPGRREPYVVADGGRIDHLGQILNRKAVPGVCMGIGVTVLAQMMDWSQTRGRVVVLVDDPADIQRADRIRSGLAQNDVRASVLPLARRRWPAVMRNPHYSGQGLILIERTGQVSVRHRDQQEQEHLEEVVRALDSGAGQVLILSKWNAGGVRNLARLVRRRGMRPVLVSALADDLNAEACDGHVLIDWDKDDITVLVDRLRAQEIVPAGVVNQVEALIPWQISIAENFGLAGATPFLQTLLSKVNVRAAMAPFSNLSWMGGASASIDPSSVDFFPVVAKPSRETGHSAYVKRVSDADALRRHLATISTSLGAETEVIVEEFVDGTEFSVDGPVLDGTYRPLVAFEKPERDAEVLHDGGVEMYPPRPQVRDAVTQLAERVSKLCAGLGLQVGWLHVEGRLRADGNAELIEINPRPGGAVLPTAILRLTGIDPVDFLVDIAVGRRDSIDAAVSIPSGPDEMLGIMSIEAQERGLIEVLTTREDLMRMPGVVSAIVLNGFRAESLERENFFCTLLVAADDAATLRQRAESARKALRYRVLPLE